MLPRACFFFCWFVFYGKESSNNSWQKWRHMIDEELKYAQSRLVNQTELTAQKKKGRKKGWPINCCCCSLLIFFSIRFFY
jgi:hypothetical protein